MSAEISDMSILIVDDDSVARRAITRTFARNGIENEIFSAQDGIEALELLRGAGEKKIAWPYLVLLDINMPRMNGIEFLKELRSDPNLSDTVVFVLTTSDDDRDMVAAYSHQIAGYLLKTNVGPDFINLIATLSNFSLMVRFHKKT